MKPPHCQLTVKAIPNASQSAIAGWLGEVLKIKLKAPPVEGRANLELERFLAERLDLPRGAVVLRRGAGARQKQVAIAGLDLSAVKKKLGAAAPER